MYVIRQPAGRQTPRPAPPRTALFMTAPLTMHDGCKMPMELVFEGRESSVPLLGSLSHCSLAPRSQDSAALKMSARCFLWNHPTEIL